MNKPYKLLQISYTSPSGNKHFKFIVCISGVADKLTAKINKLHFIEYKYLASYSTLDRALGNKIIHTDAHFISDFDNNAYIDDILNIEIYA